jgi:hypothetical protein
MLDLGLEHLGVDVGAGGAGVEAVLKSCGDSAHLELVNCDPGLSTFTRTVLSRLENSDTRCPADKAAVLVAAHKTVVGTRLLRSRSSIVTEVAS